MFASRICCWTHVETSQVTEQRYCRTNFVVSVFPAPLSPFAIKVCEEKRQRKLPILKDQRTYLILAVVDDVPVGGFGQGEHVRLQHAQLLAVVFVDVILTIINKVMLNHNIKHVRD